MEEFHKNFPSLEKQMEQEKQRFNEEEFNYCKQMFQLKYPNVNWNDLHRKYNNGIFTNDGCIHYINKITNETYLWHLNNKKWIYHEKN